MTITARLIAAVNAAVNRGLRYQSDLDQYGVPDKWVAEPASGRGDCDDYALTKRVRLLALGAPPEDVRIVLGHTWRGEAHAVVYACDAEGQWWVLDHLSGRIVRPSQHTFRPGGGIWCEPKGAR